MGSFKGAPRREGASAVRGRLAVRAGVALLAAGAAGGCAGKGDEAVPEQGPQELFWATTVRIPVHVTLLQNTTVSSPLTSGGLPGSTAGGAPDTLVQVDQQIASFNSQMATAAGSDTRRIQLVRVGFDVKPSPASPAFGSATDVIEGVLGEDRRRGVLHVVIAPQNPSAWGTCPSALAITSSGALPHEVGHLLSLEHVFDENDLAPSGTTDYREPLVRITDPTDPHSCYRTGDRICATPPDMGWAQAVASGGAPYGLGFVVCGSDHFLPCIQSTGIACDTTSGSFDHRPRIDPATGAPLVDGMGNTIYTCMPSTISGLYDRTYDPIALGWINGASPATAISDNTMAYFSQGSFLDEQFVYAHGYARWAMNEPDAVPSSEQAHIWDFYGIYGRFGNGQIPDRERSLASAVNLTTTPSGSGAGPYTVTLDRAAAGQGRRVLGVRVLATAPTSYLPGSTSTVQVVSPTGESATFRVRLASSPSTGALVADDALLVTQSSSRFFRDIRPYGAWTATFQGATASSYSSVRIELELADRVVTQNSFWDYGRGDVVVYRPSAGQAWVSSSAGSAYTFNGGFELPITPGAGVDCSRRIVGGDFDGDDNMDFLCWKSGSPATDGPGGLFLGRTWLQRAGVDPGAGINILATDETVSGDFNGDGFADLMVRRPVGSGSAWWFFRGHGDGTFDAGQGLILSRPDGTQWAPSASWTAGDFNGDGFTDLIIREPVGSNDQFFVLYNARPSPGTATISDVQFLAPRQARVGGSTLAYYDSDTMTAMDVDGDGLDDLVMRRPSTGTWWSSAKIRGTDDFNWGVALTVGGQTTGLYLTSDVVMNASRSP